VSDRAAQDEWVRRVLSVSLPPPDAASAPGAALNFDFDAELSERRAIVLDDARLLRDPAVAARIAELGAEVKRAIDAGNLGAAGSLMDAMETALGEAQRAARMAKVEGEAGHRVAYGKLLLQWRDAQATTRKRIDALAASILADPEVLQDPRYDDVKDAAEALADVMPAFSSELDDLLDGLDNEEDPAERARQVETARDLIEDFAALLDTADELAELAEFAADEYGETDITGSLRDALTEMAGALAGRV
jgi:hypothetical protein